MNLKSMIGNFFKSPFHPKKYSITVLLCLSYVLVALNSGYGFFKVVHAPDFAPAFFFTIVMATLLTCYVHELHYVLFKQSTFRNKNLILPCKFVFGILVPVGIDLVMAYFFFLLKGEGITTSTFFEIDFVLIVIYFITINIFYHLVNMDLVHRLKTVAFYKRSMREASSDILKLRTLERLEKIKDAPVSLRDFSFQELGVEADQIACVYKIAGIITIHYFNEQQALTMSTITELFEGLPPTDYVR
ncbi:MAG: hypothetical protein EON51_17750, partial [Acinetobacter sp.]